MNALKKKKAHTQKINTCNSKQNIEGIKLLEMPSIT